MKFFWVNTGDRKELVTTALESGADGVFVPKGYTKKVKELGKIKTISFDGDIKLDKEAMMVEINSKEDERAAIELSKKIEYLIIRCKDWKIIPLENLITEASCKLVAEVFNAKETKIALEIMEKGVDGVLLTTDNPAEIKKVREVFNKITLEKVELVLAKISRVEAVRMGDRVCVDICTAMKQGQGMLVGNSTNGLFLIHSESIENAYVEPRPFRVNAGPVHSYLMVPDGKTKYLSEVKGGIDSLIVNWDGNTEIATVGRSKIEKRPLILVEAEYKKKRFSVILQNAETIRLVGEKGKPISVVKLQNGDKILAHVEKKIGRHLGTKIKESITEK